LLRSLIPGQRLAHSLAQPCERTAHPLDDHHITRSVRSLLSGAHTMPMTYSRLFASLSVLLFLASPVGAQAEEEARPEPTEGLGAPSIEVELAISRPPPPASPDDPVARAFFGPLAGLGLIAASTALGAMLGAFIGDSCDPRGLCFTGAMAAIGASIGAGVGLPVLYPLGIALGADAAGGRGGVGWSYLGGLIGTAVGVGLYFGAWGIQSATDAPWAEVMVPAIVLGAGAALVGPVIAYEMSDHSARAQPRSAAHDEVTWIPTLGIDAHGARAGVAGSF